GLAGDGLSGAFMRCVRSRPRRTSVERDYNHSVGPAHPSRQYPTETWHCGGRLASPAGGRMAHLLRAGGGSSCPPPTKPVSGRMPTMSVPSKDHDAVTLEQFTQQAEPFAA